jgi:predicted RND superfamily exporter protein
VTPAPRRATAFALLVALVGATAWCAAYAEGWPSDNRPVVWMKDAHADPGFGVLRDRFGGDDAVLLRVAPATPADADRARAFAFALGPRLGALPAVLRALDPFRLPAAPKADDARIAAARAASRPIARALGLLDPAADRYDFVVRVRPDAAQTECGALARALDALRAEAAAAGAKLEAGGHPLVAAALDDEARRVERVFSPLLALASVLGVALFFRSFALAALTVLPAALASVAARAGLRAVGWDQNLILVSVGPIVFVISLATALHVSTTYRRLRAAGRAPVDAARASVREKLAAGLMSGGTTAIGFLAFLASGIEPVRRLGVATAVAVSAAIGVAYGALPVLLAAFVRGDGALRTGAPRAWGRTAPWSLRRRGAVIGLAFATTVAGFVAGAGLPFGTNALDYFPAGSRVRDEFLSLEAGGGALTTVEILAKRKDGKPWEMSAVRASATVDAALAAVPGAHGVLGPAIVLEDLKVAAGPAAALLASTALREGERLDAQREYLRWTVRIPTVGAAETLAIGDALAAAAAREPALKDADVVAAGGILLIHHVQTDLVGTLWESLGLTLVVTVGLFFLVVRSVRELLAALLANLLPVASTLLFPRLFGWPLDAATVMVASVVLGLAYNTFHLLEGAGPRPGRFYYKAGLGSFRRVGQPAGVSYLVLALGFSVLALSGFAPTARFGVLTALGVLFALLGDLFVLPAVWLRRRPAGR